MEFMVDADRLVIFADLLLFFRVVAWTKYYLRVLRWEKTGKEV